MRGRDLLILSAVLLVVGFALADALRNEAGGSSASEAGRTSTESTSSGTTTGERDDLGRASFPPVPGAGSSVVLVEAGSCAVREFDLTTGFEFHNVVAHSTCQLWAAPTTAKVAVGVGQPRNGAVPFRFVDLAHPGRDLGTSFAAESFLVWSEDGLRAAWCDHRRVGVDLEFGGEARRLPRCPVAYTARDAVLFVAGDRVVAEGRTVLTASAEITSVHVGTDGSIAVVAAGRRIERYRRGRLSHAVDLPERFHGRPATLAPDNCAALFRAGDFVQLVDVGCSPFEDGDRFLGTTGAWSSDGTWIAAGGATGLRFHDLDTGKTVKWGVSTVTIAFRSLIRPGPSGRARTRRGRGHARRPRRDA